MDVKNKISLIIMVILASLVFSPLLVYSAEAVGETSIDGLAAKAQTNGTVRIIVGLNTNFVPEGDLATAADVQNQQDSIARAQDAILSGLKNLNVPNIVRFSTIPYISLEVDSVALDAILNDPLVTTVQEDVPVPPTLRVSVPLINADDVWTQGYGYSGSGVKVAILDTGVRKTHQFLDAGKVVSEACYSTTSGTRSTTLCPNGQSSQVGSGAGVNCSTTIGGCSHGTHVAGIAAGTGGETNAPYGVARNAQVIAIQVFSRFNWSSDCGSAPCVMSYTTDQIKGLERVYALRNTYEIAAANMSLGGGYSSSYCDTDARKSIIDNLRSVGIATVISSGNDGYNGYISYPACISSAVSVGATTKGDAVASYSNHDNLLDLLAPGSSIDSSTAISNTSYAFWNGTSMAAPHVTGAFALLDSKNPNVSVTTQENALKNTGVSVSTRSPTKPRINVLAAANSIGTGLRRGFTWDHCQQVYHAIGSSYVWCYLTGTKIWVLTNDDDASQQLLKAASSNHWIGFNVSRGYPLNISATRVYYR